MRKILLAVMLSAAFIDAAHTKDIQLEPYEVDSEQYFDHDDFVKDQVSYSGLVHPKENHRLYLYGFRVIGYRVIYIPKNNRQPWGGAASTQSLILRMTGKSDFNRLSQYALQGDCEVNWHYKGVDLNIPFYFNKDLQHHMYTYYLERKINEHKAAYLYHPAEYYYFQTLAKGENPAFLMRNFLISLNCLDGGRNQWFGIRYLGGGW